MRLQRCVDGIPLLVEREHLRADRLRGFALGEVRIACNQGFQFAVGIFDLRPLAVERGAQVRGEIVVPPGRDLAVVIVEVGRQRVRAGNGCTARRRVIGDRHDRRLGQDLRVDRLAEILERRALQMLLPDELREHVIAQQQRGHIGAEEAAAGDRRAGRLSGVHHHRSGGGVTLLAELPARERRNGAGQHDRAHDEPAAPDDAERLFRGHQMATGS